MKKLVLSLIATLILVFILFSIFTSKGNYAAERLFYMGSKQYNRIKANPDVAPPEMVASSKRYLEKAINKYPNTNTAKAAYIVLADLYTYNKEYSQALDTLDSFIAKYDKEVSLLSRAHFMKALVYEKQNKWNKALEELAILKDKYANTPLGLQVPLYVANYYKQNNKISEAEKEYNNAITFYENVERQNRGTVLGYAASDFLIKAYLSLEKYEEAGGVTRETIINYPSMATLIQQLPYVEFIYVKTLKKPDKAREIYEYIIENAKDEKLKNFLQGKIEQLSKQ